MVLGGEQDELRRLSEENARLKELLTRHGIDGEEPDRQLEAAQTALKAELMVCLGGKA